MDTLLIFRDTIASNVVKVVDTCQPYIHEAETNCQDVAIVKYICISFVVSIFIIAITLGIMSWHNYRKAKDFDDLNNKNKKLEKELEKVKEEKDSSDSELKRLKNIKFKLESEKASELLDKISTMSRTKDGITDVVIANSLFELYQSIKNEFRGNDGENSSKG